MDKRLSTALVCGIAAVAGGPIARFIGQMGLFLVVVGEVADALEGAQTRFG